MVKHIDYPRDSESHNITAAIHPQLQVQSDTYCISLVSDLEGQYVVLEKQFKLSEENNLFSSESLSKVFLIRSKNTV